MVSWIWSITKIFPCNTVMCGNYSGCLRKKPKTQRGVSEVLKTFGMLHSAEGQGSLRRSTGAAIRSVFGHEDPDLRRIRQSEGLSYVGRRDYR